MAKDDSGFAEIEEYNRKLSSNPESLVFVPLAEAYRKSGMLDEAIETCLKGLQLHPSYMSARMVLGRAYMEKKMYEEAETEFGKVATADVNNIMAHSLLGQNFMLQGKFADAIKEYQKVLTLNPDDMTAQQMLNKALELARQNTSGKVEKIEVVSGLAETERAEQDRKRTLSRAEELSRQGDVDNAIKLYQLILEADPQNLVVRQRLKDLEVKKAKVGMERKSGEHVKPEGEGSLRDNDKITSDDILSVMKDTAPKAAVKPALVMPARVEPVAPMKPEPMKVLKPQPVVAKLEPVALPKVEAIPAAAESGEIEYTKLPALAKLMQTEGILGIMLTDAQGKVFYNTLKTDMEEKDLVTTVLLIFNKTEKSVAAMDYGQQVSQILITGEKGQIIFSKIYSKTLIVLADDNINLGKMRLAMGDVVKAIR